MAATVRIARPLQPYAGGEKTIECFGTNVAEVLACIDAKHPGFEDHILEPDGSFRRHLQVFVNDEDARFLDGPATAVADGDELSLFAAVSGG